MSWDHVQPISGIIYTAQWGQITPEEAARQILKHLNPTIWPRVTPSYGTTGTRKTRKARR